MSDTTKRLPYFIKAWGPSFAWMVIIVSLSLMPGSSVPSLKIPYIDKLVHLGFYTILGALLLYGFWRQYQFERIRFKFALYACAVAFFWGTLMEFFQYFFTSTRHFEYLDLFANIIGAVIGTVLFIIYFSFKKSRQNG